MRSSTLRGIDPGRMRTISYGKERPVAVCNDISCWSQNRRSGDGSGNASSWRRQSGGCGAWALSDGVVCPVVSYIFM